jgi:hypothetical protein
MDRWPYAVTGLGKTEIEAYCVHDIRKRGWQAHRLDMKGRLTGEKLEMLVAWRTRWVQAAGLVPRDVQVQIDNYVNALLRGGQLVQRSDGIFVQR